MFPFTGGDAVTADVPGSNDYFHYCATALFTLSVVPSLQTNPIQVSPAIFVECSLFR